MARKLPDPIEIVEGERPEDAKVKVPVEVRKQASLLFEIGSLYRSAGQALRSGDDIGYNRACALIEQYQALFNTLAKAITEDITREGLAAINEM